GSDTDPTRMGERVGTLVYSSPEQAVGRLDLLGPASDAYSLGAVLYCPLTGPAPFDGKDPEGEHQADRGGRPRPRLVSRTVAPALEAICVKAMALKPEDRYATALDLAADVEHWLADEPVSAHREPWTARSGRWLRRHRPLVAGAAALLLTAVVALAISTV